MKYNTQTIGIKIKQLGHNQYVPKWKGYKNAHKKFPMYHKKCGHTYMTCWNYFQSGYRCPYCSGTKKLTKKQVAKNIYKLGKGQYVLKLKGNYQKARKKIPIYHKKCGHIFNMTYNKFQQGERCPYCKHRRPLTLKYIKKQIWINSKHSYKVLTTKMNPIHAKSNIIVKHLKCGYIFKETWDRWKSGCRCPYCKSSKGETHTALYLQKHNIPYKYAYHLNCKTKYNKKLHLDFYLPQYKIGIEYDGIQHERPVNHFGGVKAFKRLKVRDNLKNKYCKKKGIYLIRIHYPYKNQHETFDKKNIKCIKHTLDRKLLPKL